MAKKTAPDRRLFRGHIIAILAAILFPVFARAREKARQASCLSNVKQLALGVMMYAQDYDELIPCVQHRYVIAPTKYWYEVIQPYVNNEQIVRCPSQQSVLPGYGYNYPHAGYRLDLGNEVPLSDILYPAEMMIFGDSNPSSYRYYLYCGAHWPGGIRDETNVVATRHNEGANFAFADGHAKWMQTAAVIGTSVTQQRFWGHPSPKTSP